VNGPIWTADGKSASVQLHTLGGQGCEGRAELESIYIKRLCWSYYSVLLQRDLQEIPEGHLFLSRLFSSFRLKLFQSLESMAAIHRRRPASHHHSDADGLDDLLSCSSCTQCVLNRVGDAGVAASADSDSQRNQFLVLPAQRAVRQRLAAQLREA
jgi:hypothetical protein